MYGNWTDHVCYDCLVECISCANAADHCFECDTSLGYAYNDYTCYNPCPLGTFLDASLNDANCTDCSPFCIECEVNSTFCSNCTLTGNWEAYLYESTCLKNCPD